MVPIKKILAYQRWKRVITNDNLPFDFVIIFDYYTVVTASELKRKLAKLGCTFEEGTRHLIVYYKRERTLMPRHPSKEIKTGTYLAILKKLGIKE